MLNIIFNFVLMFTILLLSLFSSIERMKFKNYSSFLIYLKYKKKEKYLFIIKNLLLGILVLKINIFYLIVFYLIWMFVEFYYYKINSTKFLNSNDFDFDFKNHFLLDWFFLIDIIFILIIFHQIT